MFSRVRRPAQVLFLLLALLFIGLLLWSQWDELRRYPWQLRPLWLLLAAVSIMAGMLLEVRIWRQLLDLVGGHLDYGYALRIWFLSAIVRYIPGNIWQPLGMTLLAYQRGVRPEATIVSIALYQAVNLLAVAVIAALYFPLTGNIGILAEYTTAPLELLAILVIIPVLVFIVRPQWLIGAINWVLVKFGRTALPVNLGSRQLLVAILLNIIVWLLLGATFAAITMAISSLSVGGMFSMLQHLLVSYPVAYAIGFLSFITPSGLAVREGALFVLLAPLLGGGLVTVAALAMRIWLMVVELLGAGISLLTWPEIQTALRRPSSPRMPID